MEKAIRPRSTSLANSQQEIAEIHLFPDREIIAKTEASVLLVEIGNP